MDNHLLEDGAFGDELPPLDLDLILETVKVGGEAGMIPEHILDERELAAYRDYLANELQQPTGHYDNLVDAISDSYLKKLAQDVCAWVKFDEDTRKDWADREARGIRMLGVSDRDIGVAPFEGASMVVHPLLAEAVTEFHSRAIAEMWPPEGPVKTIVLGDQSEERLMQSQRVQDYMNYQYMADMPGAFEEEDAMLFRLPLSGSCFKKVYFDPIVGKLCSRLVEPADFIVPYSATDLKTAPRYTHRYREMHNTVLKKIARGFYAKAGRLTEVTNETADYPAVLSEIEYTEGRQNTGTEDSSRHTTLEMYAYLDIPGMEDVGDDGEKSGIELPYIVWVDRDDMTVRRIQRNWKPDDDDKAPELNFAHYRFMPGLGFYGYGLLHLIGGLAAAATGSLRALLDSAAFANLQGGFRTRDSRINKNGDQPIAPGEWREVDASAEELAKSFFKLPYDEPSPTLFQLLGYLDERGQKFVGTTDVMTGDANPNAPVGTTVALIEQGAKKFSAIHRRLHVSHKEEFSVLARLNSLYLPEQGYPYYTDKGARSVFPADFDDRIDILPVSDPAVVSTTQRIMQAQAVLDLADKHPDKMDQTEALRMMLEAMRVPGFKNLLKADPVLQETQKRSLELDVEIKEAELAKLNAERTEIALKGLFSALQCAQLIAANPGIAPISDSVYLSAGGVDANGLPIADQPAIASLSPMPPPTATPSPVTTNTSPGFPGLPQTPNPSPPSGATLPAQPLAASAGVNAGIETLEAD